MRILLTNDDGFFADGLQTLYRTLERKPGHEISVVAPEGQRSATGHAITLHQPLFLTEHRLFSGKTGYAVSGMPSDCVKLAVQGELVPKPDVLISGINFGQNLGTDVFYSGTVAAAMEGVLLGIPALSVSLAGINYPNFEPAAAFVSEYLDLFAENNPAGLININIPPLPPTEWRGIRITRLGKTVYENIFERRLSPRGRVYYWQAGNLLQDHETDTDLRAIQDGYISITPMQNNLTDFSALGTWEKVFSNISVNI